MTSRHALIAGLVVSAAHVAAAQSAMGGSWVVAARDCFPGAARCTGPNAETGSWSPHVTLDVRGDTVIITASPRSSTPLLPAHVDTLPIDGKILAWLPDRLGIVRVQDADVPSDRVPASEPGSRTLWRGESWRLAGDGKSLVHEVRGPEHGDSTMHATWTYQRASQ